LLLIPLKPGASTPVICCVYHDRKLKDWLDFENADVYPHDWPDFIKPESEWGVLKPDLGLYSATDDLPAVRAKLSTSPYKRFAELLREQARS
jgi:hypothetical protein